MPLAARVSDTYVFPNGSGIIASGSSNVLIGKMPAAALGDSIAQGSSSVFINKKPAGRMGDSTLNGGKVTSGCGSVSIGG